MATKSYKDRLAQANRRVREAGQRMNQEMTTAKVAGAVGGALGGAAGPMLAGRASIGEYGDDKLGADITPAIGAGIAAASIAVPGAAGVGVAAMGGAIVGSFVGMRQRLESLGLYAGFRAATLGAE